MKKIIRISAAFAASVLAISSCSKEIAPESTKNVAGVDGPLVEKTFTVFSDDVTKTTIDGLSILWAAGDNIGVSAGTEVQKFTFSSGAGAAKAAFTGTIAQAQKYYAIYPTNHPGKSSVAATMDAPGVFTTRINNSYGSLKAGSLLFNPACAVSTDGNSFKFKSICAILKFTVPANLASKLKAFEIGTAVTTEKITCNNSGSITVDLNNNNAVTLSEANGSTLCTVKQASFTEGSYYLPVAPITLSKGFYLRLSFNDGTNDYYSYRGNGESVKLEANKVYDLGTVSDTDEVVLTEFNNGATGCEGTIYLGTENVDCSTVTEGATGKCMKYFCKSTGSSSGQVSFDLSASKPSTKFYPAKIRKAFNRTRIRVYLGELDWHPTVKYDGSNYQRLPSSLNGVSLAPYCQKNCSTLTDDEVAAFKTVWESAIKTDDWNEIEWNMADWKEDLNWSKNAYLNFYFSTTPKGANINVKKDDTFYIDNIRFVVSDSARKTLVGV